MPVSEEAGLDTARDAVEVSTITTGSSRTRSVRPSPESSPCIDTSTSTVATISASKDISHGFDGSRVVLADGATIDGIVLANGDPLIIKSMGGLTQTIPKAKVKSVNKLGRSLMFPPEMLGLDAQGVADIAAYLASDKLK